MYREKVMNYKNNVIILNYDKYTIHKIQLLNTIEQASLKILSYNPNMMNEQFPFIIAFSNVNLTYVENGSVLKMHFDFNDENFCYAIDCCTQVMVLYLIVEGKMSTLYHIDAEAIEILYYLYYNYLVAKTKIVILPQADEISVTMHKTKRTVTLHQIRLFNFLTKLVKYRVDPYIGDPKKKLMDISEELLPEIISVTQNSYENVVIRFKYEEEEYQFIKYDSFDDLELYITTLTDLKRVRITENEESLYNHILNKISNDVKNGKDLERKNQVHYI